jgi:peptide/nickel transport system substrate-binding protein
VSDEKRNWRKFQHISFDGKRFSKRVRKAETATVRHARKFLVGRLENIRSVRRHVIGWLLLVGMMIVIVGLQLLWFQRSYQTTAPASGGTYAEASLGPIDTLNPLFASSDAEISASRLLFSSLYSYDTTGHLQGDLAQSMQVDPSGTLYTVSLRPNALWHDGAHVTANDVAFTVNLIKNPATRSTLRSNWQDVTVKVVNGTTLQFQLPAVYAAFPHALTFSVLPEHLLGTLQPGSIRESAFSRAPIGSGPFSLNFLQTVNASHTYTIVHMTAFDKYYKGAPLLSRFEIHAYTDQAAIADALRTGQVNAAADLTGGNISQIDTHNYTVISRPINSGVYALFNLNTPILQDHTVRQALQLATNTAAIRSSLHLGVMPLDLPFVNGQLTGANVPHAPTPSDTQAGALLDQAGWTLVKGQRQKGGVPLALSVVTIKNSLYERALETLAGQWRKLGIVVNVRVVDTADPASNFVRNTLQARAYDVLLYELSIGGDPDVYAYWHSSQIGIDGYNFSNYSNKSADAALASARSRLEPALRNVKYEAFARQWLEDVPAIGLYQPVAPYVVNKNMESLSPNATLVSPFDRYANVLYWSVGDRSVYKTP